MVAVHENMDIARALMNQESVASIIMAAGRGSRMKNFSGNKTLLPLIPDENPFHGQRPIIHNILDNLPQGPKCIVLHHAREQVIKATEQYQPYYCNQETLNGTGGALLACKGFLENVGCSKIIITMGDVPLVQRSTYRGLVNRLDEYHMVVLGFIPESKRQYGLLQLQGGYVKKIIEWKYWKELPYSVRCKLRVCNSGIYAVRKKDLLEHLADLRSSAHLIQKEVNGVTKSFYEYFLTDLIEIFTNNGKRVGYQLAQNPEEVMGVDDIEALTKAQRLYTPP